MNPFSHLGKTLMIVGLVIVGLGLLITFAPKIPWFGKLPGDIFVKRENYQVYFPLTTCVIVSILLTLIFYLFKK